MTRRKRHNQHQQTQQTTNNSQQTRNNAPSTPWYSSNGFKIGMGIFGILILFGIIVSLNNFVTPNTQQSPNQQPIANNPPVNPVNNIPIGDTQVIKMAVTGSGYEPSTLTVQVGKPVTWQIDGTNAGGCTKYIIAQEFGISKRLDPGINTFQFTPTKTGTFPFQCSMNMVRGKMIVV